MRTHQISNLNIVGTISKLINNQTRKQNLDQIFPK